MQQWALQLVKSEPYTRHYHPNLAPWSRALWMSDCLHVFAHVKESVCMSSKVYVWAHACVCLCIVKEKVLHAYPFQAQPGGRQCNFLTSRDFSTATYRSYVLCIFSLGARRPQILFCCLYFHQYCRSYTYGCISGFLSWSITWICSRGAFCKMIPKNGCGVEAL